MKRQLFQALKIIAFFGVGFTILYLVFNNQQNAYLEECALKNIAEEDCSLMDKVIQDFSSANYWILALSIGLFMLSNVLRALRWHLLLAPLGHKPRLINSLGAIMIGYLLNLSIPRAGEIAKPASLSTNENIPLDQTIGTIVTDRIIDVVCLLCVFLLALILASGHIINYLNENIDLSQKLSLFLDYPIVLIALFFIGLFSLFLLWRNRKNLLHNPIVTKIYHFMIGIWEGIMSVFKMDRKGLFIFYSIGIWVLYYLMTYVVFFAFEPTHHLSAVAALVVFLFGSLGIVIPSPGGMGSYHFLVGQALILYGIDGADAFSFANIAFFTIQIFGNILFGGLALIILPLFNKNNNLEPIVVSD